MTYVNWLSLKFDRFLILGLFIQMIIGLTEHKSYSLDFWRKIYIPVKEKEGKCIINELLNCRSRDSDQWRLWTQVTILCSLQLSNVNILCLNSWSIELVNILKCVNLGIAIKEFVYKKNIVFDILVNVKLKNSQI